MARISTYPEDSVPHADDHVIGTNQNPGHASETVIFPLSSIEALFRNNLVKEFELNYTVLNADGTTADPPAFVLEHGLNTNTVQVDVWVERTISSRVVGEEDITVFLPIATVTDENFQPPIYRLYQIDNNNIRVEFGSEDFNARVKIIG